MNLLILIIILIVASVLIFLAAGAILKDASKTGSAGGEPVKFKGGANAIKYFVFLNYDTIEKLLYNTALHEILYKNLQENCAYFRFGSATGFLILVANVKCMNGYKQYEIPYHYNTKNYKWTIKGGTNIGFESDNLRECIENTKTDDTYDESFKGLHYLGILPNEIGKK